MTANRWALAVFLMGGSIMFTRGMTDPATVSAACALLIIGWLGAGYAWDFLRYRNETLEQQDTRGQE